jgi:hypothetical protein
MLLSTVSIYYCTLGEARDPSIALLEVTLQEFMGARDLSLSRLLAWYDYMK